MNRYTKLSLLFIVVAAIVFYLVSFRLENIEFRNDSIYTDEEIRSRLFTGGRLDDYTQFFAWRINRSSKKHIPFIEKTDVEIVDRNSVIIYVYGKSVAGCVEHMGKYMHFDREGIVVESTDTPLDSIAMVEGFDFEKVVQGEKLEMGNTDLFETLMTILKALEKNGLSAERVVFGLRNDITLYMGGDRILLGIDGDNDLRIRNIRAVLQTLREDHQGGNFRVDMRNYSENNMEVTAKLID